MLMQQNCNDIFSLYMILGHVSLANTYIIGGKSNIDCINHSIRESRFKKL